MPVSMTRVQAAMRSLARLSSLEKQSWTSFFWLVASGVDATGAATLPVGATTAGATGADVRDAAGFLRLSVSTIYALMGKGLLPYVKIGKSRRIPHRAVVELAAGGLVTRTAD